MDFSEQKKQILSMLKLGDRGVIANRSGVSRTTLNTTLAMETLNGATSTQLRVWEECLAFLKERQQRASKIESKTSAIVEKL